MRAGSSGIWRREGNVRGLLRSALFGSILALSASRPIFKADLYVIDGGSGKTRAAVDHNDLSHWLDQSDTTKQCALPAAHADFAGQLCLTFTGAQYYGSNRAPLAWSLCHNGTGFESTPVWTPTGTSGLNVLFATLRRQDLNLANGIYFADNVSASTQQYQLLVGRTAVGAAISAGPTAATGFTINTPTYADIKYREADSPEYFVTAKSAACLSGNSTNAPSAGAPQSTLVLGANAASFEDKLNGRVAWLPFFTVLDASGRAVIQHYIYQTYGLAS